MTNPARDIDWEQIRRWKFATETPPSDWPAGVKAISFSGLNLFGIDVDNNLYWDADACSTSQGWGGWNEDWLGRSLYRQSLRRFFRA